MTINNNKEDVKMKKLLYATNQLAIWRCTSYDVWKRKKKPQRGATAR